MRFKACYFSLVWLAILVVVTTEVSFGQRTSTVEPDVYYTYESSNDPLISGISEKSVDACRAKCLAEPMCQQWGYFSDKVDNPKLATKCFMYDRPSTDGKIMRPGLIVSGRIGGAAVASSQAAGSPKERDQLKGFEGVIFGSSASTAMKRLGSTAQKKPAVGKKKAVVGTYVSGTIVSDGVTYKMNYFFDMKDRMTRVELFPIDGMMTRGKERCDATSAKIQGVLDGRYGAADSEKSQGEETRTLYKFKDGNEIHLSVLFFKVPEHCLITLNYWTPEGRIENW